ncbi:MAG: cobalamin B12-binding domain-containing protein [Dehalococcoidia bacterium]|nr:cobalamin B12-binding domain-containing protein [Dehalococcoidia bacterium]
MSELYKVLISKPGIDGHWRGAIVVATALRDAGMEVVFAGNQTPAEIAETALQEDVQVVGLSVLSAGHMRLIPETMRMLKQKGLDGVLVVVGGTIPRQDIGPLKEVGVHEVFLPGTRTDVIVKYVQERMAERANCGSHR